MFVYGAEQLLSQYHSWNAILSRPVTDSPIFNSCSLKMCLAIHVLLFLHDQRYAQRRESIFTPRMDVA